MKFNSSILLSLAAVAMLSGCGSSSNPVSSVPDLDTTPPPSPANLAVQYDATSQRQMLTWSPSSAPDLDRYQVFAYSPSPTNENSYVLVGETNSSAGFALPRVSRITNTYVRVRAIDLTGNTSAFSASFTAQLLPPNDPNQFTPPSTGYGRGIDN